MEELTGIATARFGLSVLEFDELTPREFTHSIQELNKKEELGVHLAYETMRISTMILNNANLKKNDRYSDPKKFMPFPWDKANKKQSVEDMKNIMLGIASTQNKKVKK